MNQPAPTPRSPLPPIPAALTAMLSIQAGAAFAKTLFGTIGALGTTSLRITLAALLLGLIHAKPVRQLDWPQWQAILPYGVTLGLMNLAFYLSLRDLPLGLAVTIEFLGPLGVAVLASRRWTDFLWAGLALLGIVLITPWTAGSTLNPIGVFWALVAAVCWGLYIVMGQRVSRRISGRAAAAGGMMVAAAVSLLPGVLTVGLDLLKPEVLLAGLVVAIFSSALPYSLEMVALKALPARTFGVLMSVEPALAALLGWFFLHEALTLWQWTAVGCVIVASMGSSLTGAPEAHEVVN